MPFFAEKMLTHLSRSNGRAITRWLKTPQKKAHDKCHGEDVEKWMKYDCDTGIS